MLGGSAMLPARGSDIWAHIRGYFAKSEAWGDPDKMDGTILLSLFALRCAIPCTGFVVHCGFALPGHEEHSLHKIGRAVDFHIDGMEFRDAIECMELALEDLHLANSCGLGIYPDWKRPGFHLDTRLSYARWGAIQEGEKQVYVSYQEARGLVFYR